MEVMYIKYVNGKRHSIIKEGENIIMNDSKVIPFKPVKKAEKNEHIPHTNNKRNLITSSSDDKINEEITAFFFDAIHRNYLLGRKK